jgi:serine/threonine-protein phosphatase 6 regulatory ankyrin repeat subunit B
MSANKKLLGFILVLSTTAVLWVACAMHHNEQSREDSLYSLYYASQEGDLAKVKSLIRGGCPINEKVAGFFGRTPLVCAIIQDQTNVAQFLIESGADVNLDDRDGMTPLMWVATSGDEQAPLARSLIEHGANLDAKNKDGHTVFDIAHAAPPRPIITEVLETARDKQKQTSQK